MSLFGDSDGGELSFEIESDDKNVIETSEDESAEEMNASDGDDDSAPSEDDDSERLEIENNDNPDDDGLIVNNSLDNNANAAVTPQSQSSPAVRSSSASTKSNQPAPTANGVRLWPPSGKKLKSETWKHGGFKKDNKGVLQKDVIFCAHCNFSAKYCNSPTNLQRHIEREHGDVLKKMPEELKLYQSKVTDFPMTSLAAVKKYSRDSQKQVYFKNLIIKWVIKSLRPFIIVKDENLVKAFNLADPKLSIPCPDTIKSQVRKLDLKHTALVKKDLENVSFVTCTNDAGSSYGASSFIDVNIHWLNEDFKLC